MDQPALPLTEAIRRAATELPLNQLAKLGDRIAAHAAPSPLARHAIVNAVPTALFRHHAAAVYDAWVADPIGSAGVALAVRAAAVAVDDMRGEQQVSVAWTGPDTSEVPVRTTSAVLSDVIDAARRDLIIVSFAAYKVATIATAIQAAADRGVIVKLILESVVESRGKLSHEAKDAFDTLGAAVTFYVWPADLRPVIGPGHGAMHAKCAIADDHTAFVTSANLTGAAMTDNMELGLVVRGGDVPRRIARHFKNLIAAGTLRPL